MTSITVQAPRPVAAPRGAAVAAWLFQALTSGLQAFGEAQTRRLERRLDRRRQADAADLRRYAQRMLAVDARFASDLFAADRHAMMRD